MYKVKISYSDFLKIKAAKYSYDSLVFFVCKYLYVKPEQIDDIDFNYGLTIYVWLKDCK